MNKGNSLWWRCVLTSIFCIVQILLWRHTSPLTHIAGWSACLCWAWTAYAYAKEWDEDRWLREDEEWSSPEEIYETILRNEEEKELINTQIKTLGDG